MLPRSLTSRDHPPAPGVTLVEGGAQVCVYAGHADGVDVCLFEAGDIHGETERRIPITDRIYGYWFGFVPGMGLGQRYGFRVRGPWVPHEGMRYNPAKLLVDPYARAIEGEVTWVPDVYGHRTSSDLRPEDLFAIDERDSAAYVPRSVVVDERFDWGDDSPPQRPLTESVIYETHVRNLTMRLPGVPAHLRGTYAGLAHPVTIDYLTRLGVTAVELLPVHALAPIEHVPAGERGTECDQGGDHPTNRTPCRTRLTETPWLRDRWRPPGEGADGIPSGP